MQGLVHWLKKRNLPSRPEKSRVQGVGSVGCHDHFHLEDNFKARDDNNQEDNLTFALILEHIISCFHALEVETNLAKDIKAIHLVEQLHQCPL